MRKASSQRRGVQCIRYRVREACLLVERPVYPNSGEQSRDAHCGYLSFDALIMRQEVKEREPISAEFWILRVSRDVASCGRAFAAMPAYGLEETGL